MKKLISFIITISITLIYFIVPSFAQTIPQITLEATAGEIEKNDMDRKITYTISVKNIDNSINIGAIDFKLIAENGITFSNPIINETTKDLFIGRFEYTDSTNVFIAYGGNLTKDADIMTIDVIIPNSYSLDDYTLKLEEEKTNFADNINGYSFTHNTLIHTISLLEKIDSASLSITAPKTNIELQKQPTINDANSNYTVDDIVWDSFNNAALETPANQYQAIFTLTPKNGYTFNEHTNVTVNGVEPNGKNLDGKNLKITCIFTETKKANQDAPIKPTENTKSKDTITINSENAVYYACITTNTPPELDSDKWQKSNENTYKFIDLNPNTEYYIYAVKKETDFHKPSAVVGPLEITTTNSNFTNIPNTTFVYGMNGNELTLNIKYNDNFENITYEIDDNDEEIADFVNSQSTNGEKVIKIKKVGTFSLKAIYNKSQDNEDTETLKITVNQKPLTNTMFEDITNQIYTGNEIKPNLIIADNEILLTENDYDITYSENINVGTAKIIITGKGNYTGTVEKIFSIQKEKSEIKELFISDKITYGDTFEVKFTPKMLKEKNIVSRFFANLFSADKVTEQTAKLYYEDKELATIQDVSADTEAIFKVNTAEMKNNLPNTMYDGITEHIFTIKWGGDENLNASVGEVKSKLNKKEISAIVKENTYKVFDDKTSFENIDLILANTVNNDDVTAKSNGKTNDFNVGIEKIFTATEFILSGADAGYYVLPLNKITGKVEITKANFDTIADLSSNICFNDATEKAVNVALVPDNAGTVIYKAEKINDENNIIKSFSVNKNGELKYAINTEKTFTETKQATLKITITSTNYKDKTLFLIVNITDKDTQDISYYEKIITKTYGDDKFINPLTKTIVNGALTYESSNANVAEVNATTGEITIKKVGNAMITATTAETKSHSKAIASYTITVGAKELIVKPDDISIKSNQSLPTDFKWKVNGLVGEDKLEAINNDDVKIELRENDIKLETIKIGEYSIVFTEKPKFENIPENYTIKIENGILSVSVYIAPSTDNNYTRPSKPSYRPDYTYENNTSYKKEEVKVSVNKPTTTVNKKEVKKDIVSSVRTSLKDKKNVAEVKLSNVKVVDIKNIKEMITTAEKLNKEIEVKFNFNSTNEKGEVLATVTIAKTELAKVKNDINTLLYTEKTNAKNQRGEKIFEKFFKNDVEVVTFGQTEDFGVNISAKFKMDKKFIGKDINIYQYNPKTNTYRAVPKVNFVIDKNGNATINVDRGNQLIISNGKLQLK